MISTADSDNRPNLLLFMTDQQRADSVGAFGNPLAITPHLDVLAAGGVRFSQAYSQHSACSQSRISMMTGWYPHVTGHRTLDHLLQPWEPNVLATLRDAGYFVAWPGVRGDTFAPGVTETSTDFFGYTVPPSLAALAASHEERYPEGHRLRHAFYIGRLDGAAHLTPDEAAIRTAIDLLEGNLPEPFALVITLFAPHPPFAVEEPWYSLHDRSRMPVPVGPGRGKPKFMATWRDRAGLDQLEPADWAEIIATYYGMVSRLDDQFGRLQEALARTGVANRTVTFFYTDHGEYLGDFGLVEKWPSGLDDCLLRNPLIVAGPGIAENAECTSFVEMIDLPATLCDFAGTSFDPPHFGRSLRPVLADPMQPHRDAAYSEGGFRLDEESQNEQPEGHPYLLKGSLQHEHPKLVGRAIALRTTDWTYVYRSCESDELYDRRRDPQEQINLATDPAYDVTCRELRDQLLAWLVETSDVIHRRRDARIEPVLFEQLTGAAAAAPPDRAHTGSN